MSYIVELMRNKEHLESETVCFQIRKNYCQEIEYIDKPTTFCRSML